MPVLVGCAVLRVREARSRTISGGYGVGETPLPIPNRAVKPHSADGTWLARARESRSPPVYLQRPLHFRGAAFLVGSQLSACLSAAASNGPPCASRKCSTGSDSNGSRAATTRPPGLR